MTVPIIPDLPEPAYADDDSILSRRYGKEIANYFSGTLQLSFSAFFYVYRKSPDQPILT